MASSARLSRELVYLILQFLHEENYKETLHRLESESGLFCNLNYIEELVLKGDFDELQKYLGGFIQVGEDEFSDKMVFEILKQKYLEALDMQEGAKALRILKEDLQVVKSFSEELFMDLTHLLTLKDIRENPEFSTYTTESARRGLFAQLKRLIQRNQDICHKCQVPSFVNARLRFLVNQSLNWQHHLCRNPKPNPNITTLLEDHSCEPSSTPVANQLPGGFQMPLLQPPEAPDSVTTSCGQGPTNSSPFPQLPISRSLASDPHNNGDTEPLLRRARHFEQSGELKNLPSSSTAPPGSSHIYNLIPCEELPKKVVSTFHEGSEVKTMDFNPKHQTLLLVGTNNGDIAIWEVGSRVRIANRSFNIWNLRDCSVALQTLMANDPEVSVKCVMWCPDGLMFGVAYSKHIIHIHSYSDGEELGNLVEIEAHNGSVNDLTFSTQDKKLLLITCGEDKTVKVWDVATGINLHTFKGHDAPVYSVCPNIKEGIQFTFSTAMDGKIMAWLLRDKVLGCTFDVPGYHCTKMAYSSDGLRLFSVGATQHGDSHLVEWNEGEGTVKQSYHGLGKYAGPMQFDIIKKFLAVGDDHSIKFWDMDNIHLLSCTNAEGGLLALPCIRFNKDGTLLAVSTTDNGVKILGNTEGLQVLRSVKNHQDVPRVAVGSCSKASTLTMCPSCGIDMASVNQEGQNLPQVRYRKTEGSKFPRPKEITEPSQLRSTRLPDNHLPVKIIRLIYANSGGGVLALAYNGVHKLWKWQKTEQNPTGTATAGPAPQLWQPASGAIMTNDIHEISLDNTVPCLALSKNYSYCLSASGGKVSLFNMANFKAMTTFMEPPPAATYIAFHPEDNNIIAIGLSDASIGIYSVRSESVMQRLNGHEKSVTGLTFSVDNKILISSDKDAQLCVWSIQSWEKLTSKFVKLPSNRSNNPQAGTRVYFSLDQTRLLVVHETQIALYDTVNLDRITQWVPQQASGAIKDAVYSCNGKSVFVSIEDGSVNVLSACHLRLMCQINYTAYMPSRLSATRGRPNAIAAHPSFPNQLALGLSNGRVYVLEPLESDNEWGTDPSTENAAGSSSTNHVAVADGV